jgi:putative component of membrane protein insertase Oxa1/YidC/SpoIIIJ protein YidD
VYFREALEKKGLFRGFGMGVWRILRCNPFCTGGYDPVEKPPAPLPKETAPEESDEKTADEL